MRRRSLTFISFIIDSRYYATAVNHKFKLYIYAFSSIYANPIHNLAKVDNLVSPGTIERLYFMWRWPSLTPATYSWPATMWHIFFAIVQAIKWKHWTTQSFIYTEGPSLGGWFMIPNRHRTDAEESNEASSAALELRLIEVHTRGYFTNI